MEIANMCVCARVHACVCVHVCVYLKMEAALMSNTEQVK